MPQAEQKEEKRECARPVLPVERGRGGGGERAGGGGRGREGVARVRNRSLILIQRAQLSVALLLLEPIIFEAVESPTNDMA